MSSVDHWSEDPNRVPVLDEDGEPIDGSGYVPGSVPGALRDTSGPAESPPLVEPREVDPGEQTEIEYEEREDSVDPSFTKNGQPLVGIPGEGESSDRCGTWIPQSFCDGDDAHVQVAQHLCGRRECPRCWSGQWAGPRTTSVVQRLQAARWAEEDGIDRRSVHVALSPPPGEISNVPELFEARPEAIDLAKAHGIRGGTIIVHPYRATDETKRNFAQAKEAGEDAAVAGIWRFIRENDSHWYGQVYWSPHFHIVGLARDVQEGGQDDDGEWTIQNLSTGKGVEPNPGVDRRIAPMTTLHEEEPYEDLIGVVRYLLSHTAAVEGRQGVTWFGELHGTNFDPEEELSEGSWNTIQRRTEELVGHGDDHSDESDLEEQECPVEGCEGHLHHITEVPAYIDQRGDDLSIEALVRLRTSFEWFIESEEEAPREGWPSVRTKEEAERIVESFSP